MKKHSSLVKPGDVIKELSELWFLLPLTLHNLFHKMENFLVCTDVDVDVPHTIIILGDDVVIVARSL